MPLGIIIALIIAAGAGVSYSASNDLPGDALYKIKTQINEPVSDAVALSSQTQAETDASVSIRRVREVEDLAVRGSLSAQLSADLAAKFEERVDAFTEHILELRARGDNDAAAEAASDFEAELKAHERVLAQLEARNEHVAQVREKVSEKIGAVSEARADAEARVQAELGVSVEAAARGRLNAVENKIAEVENFLSRMGNRLSAEARAEAETALSDAMELKADGEAELEDENWSEAFIMFQQAHRAAQNAKLTADLGASLNITVDHEDERSGQSTDDDMGEDEVNEEDEENEGENNAELRSENSIRIDLGL